MRGAEPQHGASGEPKQSGNSFRQRRIALGSQNRTATAPGAWDMALPGAGPGASSGVPARWPWRCMLAARCRWRCMELARGAEILLRRLRRSITGRRAHVRKPALSRCEPLKARTYGITKLKFWDPRMSFERWGANSLWGRRKTKGKSRTRRTSTQRAPTFKRKLDHRISTLRSRSFGRWGANSSGSQISSTRFLNPERAAPKLVDRERGVMSAAQDRSGIAEPHGHGPWGLGYGAAWGWPWRLRC